MKVLITGGCGFIGKHLAKQLIKNKHDVVLLDNYSISNAKDNLADVHSLSKIKCHNVDICDYEKLSKIIKKIKPNAVFHFAGRHSIESSLEDPVTDAKVNILGTVNLLEAIRLGSKKSILLYPSSYHAYGFLDYIECLDDKTRYTAAYYPNGFNEDVKKDFHLPNACSIGSAEQYVYDYHRLYGLQTVVFRQSYITGEKLVPGKDDHMEQLILDAIQQKNGQGDPIVIDGTGKEVIDILYINDLIQSYMKLLEYADRCVGQIINVGGGVENSVSKIEVLQQVEQMLNFEVKYKTARRNENRPKFYVTNYQKARSLLHWGPVTKRQEIINILVHYYMNHSNANAS